MTPGKMRRYGLAMIAAAEMSLRQTVADAFIVFTVLVQPLIVAILALWVLRDRGGDYAIFVVVGSGMTGLWSSLLFICGNSITVERWTGTLETLTGVPTPMPVIVFGKNLANVMQSLASMVVGYGLASLLFGYPLSLAQPGLFLISLVFTIISFVSFGLIIAPVFIMNPGIQGWQNAMEFPVYILSGFLFPIALLPGWTTPLSYVLAPYWAARALHGAARGGTDLAEVALCWGMMALFSAIYLFISSRLFSMMIHKARVDATLNMY
jgi:ABC-2 type transport system permease protein